MARLQNKTEVVRALFARSGNQCAFPGCTNHLVNSKNQFIGQICHIESASKGGERYNVSSNDEQRRSYDNLLLLCYPHHIETNDVAEYSTERMKQIKIEHEKLFLKSNFKIDEAELMKLTFKMESYWQNIDILNKMNHQHLDTGLVMKVDGKSNFNDVLISAREAIYYLKKLCDNFRDSDDKLLTDFHNILKSKDIDINLFSDIKYYNNPFVNRNWESHNLGIPNWLNRLKIDLTQIEVKFYEEFLKINSQDREAISHFEEAKKRLIEYAETAIHID